MLDDIIIECETVEEKVATIHTLRSLGFDTISYISNVGQDRNSIRDLFYPYVCCESSKRVYCLHRLYLGKPISYKDFENILDCKTFLDLKLTSLDFNSLLELKTKLINKTDNYSLEISSKIDNILNL